MISKNSSNPTPAAEAKDGAPVASGTDWLHIAGLAGVVEGHISEEGLQLVMAALERDCR